MIDLQMTSGRCQEEEGEEVEVWLSGLPGGGRGFPLEGELVVLCVLTTVLVFLRSVYLVRGGRGDGRGEERMYTLGISILYTEVPSIETGFGTAVQSNTAAEWRTPQLTVEKE